MRALEQYKHRIRKVSPTGWGCYCLLDNHTVIVWGYNMDNRCGIDTNGKNIATPIIVPINDKIVDISAGQWLFASKILTI